MTESNDNAEFHDRILRLEIELMARTDATLKPGAATEIVANIGTSSWVKSLGAEHVIKDRTTLNAAYRDLVSDMRISHLIKVDDTVEAAPNARPKTWSHERKAEYIAKNGLDGWLKLLAKGR